jgi:O-antigen ligase
MLSHKFMDLFLFIFFLLTMLAGPLFGIPVKPGITIYLHDIAIVLFAMYTTTKYWNKIRFPNNISLCLLFVSTAILSLVFQIGRLDGFALFVSSLYIVRYAAYITLPVFLLTCPLHAREIRFGLLSLGIGFAGLGLVQYVLYPDLRNLAYLGWDPHFNRVFSTFLDPNFAGIMFTLTILLGFVYVLGSTKRTWWHIVSLCVLIAALLLTFSRSSYLALILGISIIGIRMQRKKIVLALLVVCAFAIIVFPKQNWEGQKLFRTVSASARVGNWVYGWNLFVQKPVFGWGFDALRYVGCPYQCPEAGGVLSHASAGLDNSFLFVLASSGIAGFMAYIWFLYSFFHVQSAHLKKMEKEHMHTLFIASLSAVGVHSFFINSQFYPWVILWMWALYASEVKASTEYR